MTVVNAKPARLRFRRSGALWLAAVLMVIFVVPFAGSVFVELRGVNRAVLTPVAIVALAIPILIAAWSLRSGVDVTPEGLKVKALFASRAYPWAAIRGFDIGGRTVYALLDGDRRLPLPAVRAVDVPRLIAAGGEELTDDENADVAEPDRTATSETDAAAEPGGDAETDRTPDAQTDAARPGESGRTGERDTAA